LPLRFEYNNNYFNDQYQGIPIGGYTQIFEKLLEGIEVKLNYNYNDHKGEIPAKTIIHTGSIDEYYDYCFGELEYRSLRFEEQ
jgi:UDP-galactopyranose mutase